MLDADGGEVDVVLRRLRLQSRGLAQRVVGLVDAARAHEGARGQVVQLGRRLALRDQLLGHPDGARVVAGLDEHEGLVVPGRVRIVVGLARGPEESRCLRLRARLAEDHPRVEQAGRVLGRNAVEHRDRVLRATGVEQRAAVVNRPRGVLREARAALLVVRERFAKPLRPEVDLREVEMRVLVRGHHLQRLFEESARLRVAAGVVFVHGQVLEGRGEGGIEGQRFPEARIGRVAPARAGERFEVPWSGGELPIEILDGGRELVPSDVEERAVVRSGAALGRGGVGRAQQQGRREAPGDAAARHEMRPRCALAFVKQTRRG